MKVEIEYLNTHGIGIAKDQIKKTFIPFSLEGEVAEVAICEEKSKFIRADIVKILTKSKNRQEAPCPYFTKCGGCTLQHMNEHAYISFKKNILDSCLKNANIPLQQSSEPIMIGDKKRRRTSFKAKLINNEIKLGYYQENSHNIVDINNCLILVDEFNLLLPELKELLGKFTPIILSKLPLEIHLTSAANGIDILFKSKHPFGFKEKKLLTDFASNHNIARINLFLDDIYSEIYLKETPFIDFKGTKIPLPKETFLQVSKESENIMADFIMKHVISKKPTSINSYNILDLFAGIGTYSVPMSEISKVVSVEGNKEMANILKNISKNIIAQVKDLYKNPVKHDELDKFDLIVINPPRTGAEPQIKQISKSNIKSILMVSCDLNSFAKDAKILTDSGFRVKDLIAVDQFYYTTHLEILALFEK